MELVSHALVALGLVAPKGVKTFDGLFAAQLEGDEPRLRWGAAVAWALVAGEAVPAAALAELRVWASGCGDDYDDTVWEVTRSQFALRLLDDVAEPVALEVRAGLVAAELAKTPNSNWHNHFISVMEYAFRDLGGGKGLSFADLTPPQRAVVTWLIDRPQVFGSFGPEMVLGWYGLPATPEALRAYAGAP